MCAVSVSGIALICRAKITEQHFHGCSASGYSALTLARLEMATAASTLAWSAIGVVASAFVVIAGPCRARKCACACSTAQKGTSRFSIMMLG